MSGELYSVKPLLLDDIEHLTEILDIAMKNSGAAVCGYVNKIYSSRCNHYFDNSHALLHS